MGPSRSDKSRTANGLGLITSVLLSPQNPQQTPTMGLGKFLGLSSGSGSSSQKSRGVPTDDHPPLGPGSSKVDYAYGLNTHSPPTSSGLAQSYYDGGDDVPSGPPPAYYPQDNSGFHDYATDLKMPDPRRFHLHTPDRIHKPTNSVGEYPLRALFAYDIVIIVDDSNSMMIADNLSRRTRWTQVSDSLYPIFSRSGVTDVVT